MSESTENLEDLKRQILVFRDARDWKQFHNPKDLSISIALEAAELLEHFQWKNPREVQQSVIEQKAEIVEEIADIFNYLILLAHELDIDIVKATRDKIMESEKKYPVDKAKGTHKKYTVL